MAESGFTGVVVDVMPAGFEVSANPSQDNLWALGCDITIEDFDAAVHEIRLEDISLSGNISVGEFSVDITPDKVNVMDLDVNVVIDGLNSSILESQVVPYDKILKITNLSPETSNEKRYAASARSAKIIYDLISSLSLRVNVTEGDIESLINIVGGIGEETSGLKDKLKILDSIKDMFEWDDEAHTRIRTKHDLFSERTIASGGKSSSGTGGAGGGFVVLEDWLKYDATLPQVLGAVLGVELHERLNALEEGSSDSPYATISFVEQAISDLVGTAPDTLDTIEELATALKNNKDIVDTLDAAITAKADKTDLDDAVGRIEDLENGLDLDYDGIIKALGFTPFNNASFTKENIKSTLGISDWALASSKPSYAFSELTSHPTKLSGYGITDAYTKTQVNGLLEDYLPLSGGEVEWLDVTGALSANGGVLIPSGKKLTIGNATLEWDGTALKVTGNMYATGTLASGGKGTAGSVAGSLTGDILPVSNYTYNIGAVDQYYKYIMGNVFYAGASTNNLNLVCGTSKDIRFGCSANPANGSTYFGTWGKTNGLVVSTNMSLDSGKTLTIGDVTLSASGGKLYANGVAIN